MSTTRWLVTAALPPDICAFSDKPDIVFREAVPPSMLEREWINHPGPVFRSRARAGDYRILPDVIEFCCKLSAAFVSTHPMIKIPFLPNDVIDSVMKTFPVSDDFAH